MIFFTADTHFGHNKIRGYCNRPFDSVQDMDSAILDSINQKVKKKDTLYFIGDFCHRGGDAKDYLANIECKNTHLIIGNHDNLNKVQEYFKSISYIKEIVHCNKTIVMCHYPMRSWNRSYKGSWMLYGHVHGRLHKEDIVSDRFTLDVGVDNKKNGSGFGSPWSFKEIQQEFRSRGKKNSRSAVDKSITGDRMN